MVKDDPILFRKLIGLMCLLLAVGCNGSVINLGGNSTMFPTMVQGSPLPTFSGVVDLNVTSIAPQPAATTPPTNNNGGGGWIPIANGLEYRQMTLRTASGISVGVIATRVDSTRALFKVYYTPGQGHSLTEWQGALSKASLIVNGNYFDPTNKAIGLVVSDTIAYGGSATRSDAGMFQVTNGIPRVRSLWLEPVNAGERFEQVLQGFPILAAQGQAAPINPDLDTGAARRTVIATDTLGRILILVTPSIGCTLTEMGNWLVSAGLDVDTALNLDGGRSTALYLMGQFAPGLGPTPVVLAVYPR